MSPRIPCITTAAGLCAVAAAQTPSFIYALQGVPLSMTPGQTAVITIVCGVEPGPGGVVSGPTGPLQVLALASGGFDLGATAGVWQQPQLIAPFNFPGTSAGTVAGGAVTGIAWHGEIVGLPHYPLYSPVAVWTGIFAAPGSGSVTISLLPLGPHGAWAGLPGQFPVEVTSNAVTGAQSVIRIVPSPGGVALLALGGVIVFGSRFRRKHHAAAVVPCAGAPPASHKNGAPL